MRWIEIEHTYNVVLKSQANKVNCCRRGNGICPTPGVSLWMKQGEVMCCLPDSQSLVRKFISDWFSVREVTTHSGGVLDLETVASWSSGRP